MLSYGGGGHSAAGTCQVENNQVDTALNDLIQTINNDNAGRLKAAV